MSDYEQDHVTYDEHEMPVTLHCLKCHAVIARRDETPSREPEVAVHSLVKGPNYREVYVELSDGSVAYFPFCSDCVRQPIDGALALEAVKRGWEQALVEAGRPDEAIQMQRDRVKDLTVTKVGGSSNAR
jgi:hypothetical protein